jgi:hypothetical protein
MTSLHLAPLGHVVLPEPDFGRPAAPGERIVRPGRRKGGRRA